MSEYADGFDDGKGEKFDELMVEIVTLREQVEIANRSADDQMFQKRKAEAENATLRNALSRLVEVHDAMGGMCSPERILAEEALNEEGK
jgi:hypothetical protein